MEEIRRGEVYYIEKAAAEGSEQHGGRPAIIVSNDLCNKHSPTVEVVFLTTKHKNTLPTHVQIASVRRESTALCEQVTTVSKTRIGDYAGAITENEESSINRAIAVSLGLNDTVIENHTSVQLSNLCEIRKAEITKESEVRITAERDVYKELYENLLLQVVPVRA